MPKISPFLLSIILGYVPANSAANELDNAVTRFRTTLSDLVRANTTSPPGNEARAVAIIAKRLKKAGVPYHIAEFAPGRQNIRLVIELAGSRDQP